MRMPGRALAGTILVAVLAAGFIAGSALPAAACSCARSAVTESVRRADAVYIARRRPFDFLPGANFRVVRVLKGPIRSNLRVEVAGGGSSSCGTSLSAGEYVLTAGPNGSIHLLSACNEHMRGAAAVREAERLLGKGFEAPWKPDFPWLAQWLAIAAIGALLFVRRKRRLRAERAEFVRRPDFARRPRSNPEHD
jgi:hypothetical protein